MPLFNNILAHTDDSTHLLTISYRGYPPSTGTPTEAGLITDGTALLNFITDTCRIPPESIVIMGHSLGTAVASAVYERYVSTNSNAEPESGAASEQAMALKGMILISGFANIPHLLESYRIGGVVPILSPLISLFPGAVTSWLQDFIIDRWDSAHRLTGLARTVMALQGGLRVHIIHAVDDKEIFMFHSDALFKSLMDGARGAEDREGEIGEETTVQAELGKVKEVMWHESGGRERNWVKKSIVEVGGKVVLRRSRLQHNVLIFVATGHGKILRDSFIGQSVRGMFDDGSTSAADSHAS